MKWLVMLIRHGGEALPNFAAIPLPTQFLPSNSAVCRLDRIELSSLSFMTFSMPRALFRGPKQGFSLRSGRNDRSAAGVFSCPRSPRVMAGAAEAVEIG